MTRRTHASAALVKRLLLLLYRGFLTGGAITAF